jgi:hypothetical protein
MPTSRVMVALDDWKMTVTPMPTSAPSRRLAVS